MLVLVFSACSSNPKVQRVDSATQVDLSGYWNDTDVRIVCRALIDSCINSTGVNQAIASKGNRIPTVIIGNFRNDSDEHLDTSIITSNMRTAIINSGRLEFVAGGNTRDELRAERQDQQSHASEATAASVANETGADFMLTGSVRTIIDSAGNQTVRTYIVTAELTNIETNRIIWSEHNDDVKKIITRPRAKL
jgi:uncharacterized protein (TIGR02722 family)